MSGVSGEPDEARDRAEPTSAERIARTDAIFRDANEEIARAAEAYGVDMRVPFVCECADPRCMELVRLSLDEYAPVRANPRWFVNAIGHEAAAQGAAVVVARHDGYVVVEKLGKAGEVADGLDSRSEA